jgi:Ca-activated chloride channel family protein
MAVLKAPSAPAPAGQVTDFDPATASSRPVKARRLKQTGGRFRIGGAAKVAVPREFKIAVPAGRYAPADGAVLFDSTRDAADVKLPPTGRLTSLSIESAVKADAVGDVVLLVFVGDPTAPRARVRLADLLRSGRRPLNVRRDRGQAVRLVLEDPTGSWRSGVPALTVVLGWGD